MWPRSTLTDFTYLRMTQRKIGGGVENSTLFIDTTVADMGWIAAAPGNGAMVCVLHSAAPPRECTSWGAGAPRSAVQY